MYLYLCVTRSFTIFNEPNGMGTETFNVSITWSIEIVWFTFRWDKSGKKEAYTHSRWFFFVFLWPLACCCWCGSLWVRPFILECNFNDCHRNWTHSFSFIWRSFLPITVSLSLFASLPVPTTAAVVAVVVLARRISICATFCLWPNHTEKCWNREKIHRESIPIAIHFHVFFYYHLFVPPSYTPAVYIRCCWHCYCKLKSLL